MGRNFWMPSKKPSKLGLNTTMLDALMKTIAKRIDVKQGAGHGCLSNSGEALHQSPPTCAISIGAMRE